MCDSVPVRFSRVREIYALLVAALLVNAATALGGASVAFVASGESFFSFWRTWWVADGLGLLLITPLITNYAYPQSWKLVDSPSRFLELLLLGGIWSYLTYTSFHSHPYLTYATPQPYLLFALLLWPAYRFECRGVTLALILVPPLALSGSIVHATPLLWNAELSIDRLLLLQTYLSILAVTGLMLAASLSDARAAAVVAEAEKVRFRTLFAAAPVGLVILDRDMRIVQVNRDLSALLHRNSGEIVGRRAGEGLGCLNSFEEKNGCGFSSSCPDCPLRLAFEAVLVGKRSVFNRLCNVDLLVAGEVQSLWLRVSVEPLELGDDFHAVVALHDCSAEQKALLQEKKRAKEKDVLLREIHHRVKNNMQIIVSMVRLRARRTQDDALRSQLFDIQGRVEAMALIHEALCRSENVAEVEAEEYIKRLCANVGRSFDARKKITLHVDIVPIVFGPDQAVALGTVLCELLTNAYKYAFHGNKEGRIDVTMIEDQHNTIQLRVADTGIGFTHEQVEGAKGTIGLRLVEAIVTRELAGTLTKERRERGSAFLISFANTKQ